MESLFSKRSQGIIHTLYVFLIGFAVFSLNVTAAEPQCKTALGDTSENIIFTDVDKDGDPDVLERWWHAKRCRWIDENDDMSKTDRLGDIVSDCLQADMDGDGTYDGPEDMCVKWADNDHDGKADFQIIVINPKTGEETKFGGIAHYMVFEDTDHDGVMGYFDWARMDFPCWKNTGRCNFSPDYNGDSIFLKAHMAPFALSDARLNWENPFAFYDTDDDGCTEMSVRYVDNPGCDAKADAVFVSYDIDNDTQRDNEMDYDFSLHFAKNAGLEYRHYANPCPDLKAADWVLPYFQHTEWRVIDELIYVPHSKCYEEAFKPDWDRCYFVFDEDDDDHRWERVELYYPNDPYALRIKNSYEAKRDGENTPMNIHPQSDSLGDRGEFDTDNSGKGKLYFSPWDGRLHLYGAEWGAWTIDSKAQYNGATAMPQVCSNEIAKALEAVVLYEDTDKNGYFDLIKFDDNGDKEPELVINLLDYGTDVCELIDPAEVKWRGLHERFKIHSKQSWQQAYTLYRAFWKTGLSIKEIDDLAFASSTWEKYFHGAKLKEAIFRELAEALKDDDENLKTLYAYYFSGNFEKMSVWIQMVNFAKS